MIWVQWPAISYGAAVKGNLADLSEGISRIFGSSGKESLIWEDVELILMSITMLGYPQICFSDVENAFNCKLEHTQNWHFIVIIHLWLQ